MEDNSKRTLRERLRRWAVQGVIDDEEDEEAEVTDIEEEIGVLQEATKIEKAQKRGGSEFEREEKETKEVEDDKNENLEVEKEENEVETGGQDNGDVHKGEEVQGNKEEDEHDWVNEVEEGDSGEEVGGDDSDTEEVEVSKDNKETEVGEMGEEEEDEEMEKEGENELTREGLEVKDNGEVDEELEEEVDAREDRQMRIEEEQNHDEEEQMGPHGLAEEFKQQIRRIDDTIIQQNQRRESGENKKFNTDSVEFNNKDSDLIRSDGGCYNFESIDEEEGAVEKQKKNTEENEGYWADENCIMEGWISQEREEELESLKLTAEKETECQYWTTKEEESTEESTEEEEKELEIDEDIDNDDEDVVKTYCKGDHLNYLFSTLNEFRAAALLTDLTLITEDGKDFHVHSTVIAAVSSLIRESLSGSDADNGGINEKQDEGLHKWSLSLGPEVDPVGLEAVVEFAYTGLISCLNKDTVMQIRAAAKTTGAPRVLYLCTEVEEKSKKALGQKIEERISPKDQLMISLQSIKRLWMGTVGCDVLLEALGGTLHAHRVVLAVWSDYFRSMFTLDMRESHQSTVILPFLLASELEVLIDCSYCGALPLTWKCVFEITSTALQLQFHPALTLCLQFLQQEINPHFCLDVASFAEAYEMVQLLEDAEDFVLRQFQKVAKTSKFKDLPAKKLLRYLNSNSLCVSSELVVFKAVVAWIQAKPKKRLKRAKDLMKTIHFPLMTFKEFKVVQSQNIWSDQSLAELYQGIFERFCVNDTAPQSQCRIYLPKESLVLIGGDQTSDDLSSRSISREVWFGNSLRNHIGIKKSMEWRRLGDMPDVPRFSHEVVVLKGQLYVFGGKKYYGTNDTLSSVYRYEPLQNSWERLAEMQKKRSSFSVVVLDGKIYAIGGYCDVDFTETVEQYFPTTNSWRFTCPLERPQSAHVAKVLGGQIFVSGGLISDNQCLSSMFQYHPETGSTFLASMTNPRANHCMDTLGECLYVAGGITVGHISHVIDQLACEVYSPVNNSWTAFTSLPVPHVGAGSAVLEGKFYVLGGYSHEDYSDTNMVHRFDPTTQRWENMGKMPGPNNDIRASLLRLPQHFRL